MRTLLVGLLTCGCSLIVPEGDFGGDSGGDTDSESESDTGTGADSDTDSDTDTDTDSDTDTDADAGDPLDCAGGRLDATVGLCWQYPESDEALAVETWQSAMDYCDDLVLAGHDDWYLPGYWDYIHLLGGCSGSALMEIGGYCSPCFASWSCSLLFPDGVLGVGSYYWTSTPDVLGSTAWTLRCSGSLLYAYPLSTTWVTTRCVREED